MAPVLLLCLHGSSRRAVPLGRVCLAASLRRCVPPCGVAGAIAPRRNITGKEMRASNPDFYARLPPWPYHKKGVRSITAHTDVRTLDRFNSNTKIITVDGPIGVGKTSFARQLAEEFDMLYMPEADIRSTLTNPLLGIDYTEFNEEVKKILPWYSRMTVQEFYEKPDQDRTVHMQYFMMRIRLEQYMDAMEHVMNTGQGVVLDRSIYSDFVFADAIYKAGYMSYLANNRYWTMRDDIVWQLLHPHLAIYLDIDVDTVRERIRQRARPEELNTRVLSRKYLTDMEESYKQHFLMEMREEAEVLIYDWTNFGDMSLVVEEIEGIDFDSRAALKKFKKWDNMSNQDWFEMRYEFGRDNRHFMQFILNKHRLHDIPEFNCPDPEAVEELALLADAYEQDVVFQRPEFKTLNPFVKPTLDVMLCHYSLSVRGAWNNCAEAAYPCG